MQFLKKKPYFLLFSSAAIYLAFIVCLFLLSSGKSSIKYDSISVEVTEVKNEEKGWTGIIKPEEALNFQIDEHVIKINTKGSEHFVRFKILQHNGRSLKVRFEDLSILNQSEIKNFKGVVFEPIESDKKIIDEIISL